MSLLDWVVLVCTVGGIVLWGMYRERRQKQHAGSQGASTLTWPTIGLSVMATQASAITFLSVPGQAYEDGMRFLQFYLGQPIALVLVAAVFVPFYYRLRVRTAYEYLESRFDGRVRVTSAFLFLVQRGLSAGITIFAPAIILSSILGWSLNLTCLLMGVFVIGYTVSGGSAMVSQTQKQQMIVILLGMVVAGVILALRLPEGVSVQDAATLAGASGRMNLLNTTFDLSDRYNLWSGLIGGFFLALGYFGTDQSQVQRYLNSRSMTESRLGLLFNGVFKIPMQAGILFVGILLFAFHLFVAPPLHFNPSVERQMQASTAAVQWQALQQEFAEVHASREQAAETLLATLDTDTEATSREAFVAEERRLDSVRARATELVETTFADVETKDGDYVFISFVLHYMPHGLIGLLLAVIMMAAMSSTAGELDALGTTTASDVWKRLVRPNLSDAEFARVSRLFTAMWGVVALGFALFASLLDNLIEAVNILGSLFYGTVLGIFLTAFLVRRAGAVAVLVGAAAGQTTVLVMYAVSSLGFLWYNLIASVVVVTVAWLVSFIKPNPAEQTPRK
ncbi:MAG: sodium:solute symporter [Myxococcales bacterium]|nr:sodium:solute symporter [Myxococcales bacterium]